MRIGLAQIDCEVGDLSENTKKMESYVTQAVERGCDVVTFPEMSDTGYLLTNIIETGSRWDDGPVPALRETARTHSVHIVAGVSEREGDVVYNAVASIGRNGEISAKFRKTHLITVEPMFENRFLGRGEELVISSVAGTTSGFMTCYELRFPEICRALTLGGADIIFFPSAWPMVRKAHWDTLIRARAIENQVFVVATDRVGTDGPGLIFAGTSQVVDPYGTVVATASEIDETLLVVDLDLERLSQTRLRMRIFDDRRPDLYDKPVRVMP